MENEMGSCNYCEKPVYIGGIKKENQIFCNIKCQENWKLLNLSYQIPNDKVDLYVSTIHSGSCPKCKSKGPVDVHDAYKVTSVILMTFYGSKPVLSCKSCAVKSQIGASIYTFLFGWWGFPSGVMITPIYLFRNIMGMIKGPDASKPSARLEQFLRVQLASKVMEKMNQPK
jgi:hypothetical protein